MTKRRAGVKTTKGSALCAVLVLVGLVGLAIGIMCSSSIQRSRVTRRLADRARALAIAEAGVQYAYSVLLTNFNARTNPASFPATAFRGGTFDPEVTAVGDSRARVFSTGVFHGQRGEAALDVVRGGAGGFSSATPGGAFGHAIVSGGRMTWGGTGKTKIMNGTVHANGPFKMNGTPDLEGNLNSSVEVWSTGDSKVLGDVSAPAFRGMSPDNVTGSTDVRDVPLIPIPDLDLTPYYLEALKNGEVYSGDQHFASGDVRPNGGIMWVEGDIKISTVGAIVGCIIATGSIEITSGGSHEKVGSYPALVSRDGDIRMAGSGSVHGLVYARTGGITKMGDGTVVGSMVCAGSFQKNGSWDLLVYEDSTPVPPGASSAPSDTSVRISAWQH